MAADPSASSAARWEEIFDELVELTELDRARRLCEVRAHDAALAGQLERLLAADAATTDLLEGGAPDLLDEAADAAGEAEPLLPAGTAVGSWRVLSLLGRGGMGEVYLAERSEPAFEQRVALKVIRRGMDSQAIVRRFVRERQILARLDHPNLARLLDGGTGPDGRPYFALEWVDGEPITDYCARCDLDLPARLRLIQTVCQAVDSAHRRLVVHRDLKPANILVTPDGTAKLLDFGIAKLLELDEPAAATVTREGARILTPAYAAPEQILGEPVTTATDIYALGVLLYEVITGTLPHRRDQRALHALAAAVENETVERPSAVLRRPGEGARLARQVAGDLDLIVLTALHRDPARRYSSAQALADDLGNFLAGLPIRARRDEVGYRVRKFLGRHRAPAAAVAAGVAALVAGLALSLWQAHTANLAARRADAEAQRAARVKSLLISVLGRSDPLTGESSRLTARDLLAHGAAGIESSLAGEPEVQADLLDAVARIENNLGLLDPALAHARRALELRLALPPAAGRIGLSRLTLGDVQVSRGHLDEARASLEAALALLVPAYGAGSVEVAAARRSLASTLQDPAGRARAAELLRQALATFVRRYGEDHVESAETLHELGKPLEDLERYGEAEAAFRRSAALLTRLFGPRSINVALVKGDLAGLLDRLGRETEAKPLFEESIAGLREAFGPHDRRLADMLYSYAILLIGDEEPAAADKALAEALGIYGPESYDAGHCLRFLGTSAMKQERYAQAADFFTRAAATYRLRGDDNQERWRAFANLGWAHSRLGRPAQARREIEAAVAALERLAGSESYVLLAPFEQLGEAQAAAGDAPAAVATLRRERALAEKLFDRGSRQVAAADVFLARALVARGGEGDGREARRVLDEGMGLLGRLHPRGTLYAESLLDSGRLALAAGDRPRARRDLAAAEPLLAARKGPDHDRTREAHRLLAAAGREG
ncbi:MAG TPA: serine/threonine-protein kinase [Thermoanaerobaculia bacterium]|nr:serine/threonine-protein kinase [Thermoanaerobaculia bacterium]